MSRPLLGVISGVVFGCISVGMMLPMDFPDKTAALLGAFLNRFAIGLVIGSVRLPWPGWAVGLFFGVLLSLPDAIITYAYAPILVPGAAGGVAHRRYCSGLEPPWQVACLPLPWRQREPLRGQWATRADEGTIFLGLQDAYAMSFALNDDLGVKFQQLRLHERERSPLTARNQSILAHGFDRVSDKVFEQLWTAALQLACTNESDLPLFPKLGV